MLRDFLDDGTDGSADWALDREYVYRGGQLLAVNTASGTQHYSLDHLGSPRLVTDGNRRKIFHHHYLPFGEQWTVPADPVDGSTLRFTGHERDDDLRGEPRGTLDYMHARFYSNNMARFTSVDPLLRVTSAQSWNRYAYTVNNPVNYIDPDGRFQQWHGAFNFGYALLGLWNSLEYGGFITVQGSIDVASARADAALMAQAAEASRVPGDVATKGNHGHSGKTIFDLWECVEGAFTPFIVSGASIVSGSVTAMSGAALAAAGVATAGPSWGTSLIFVPAGGLTGGAGLYLIAFGASVQVNHFNNMFGTQITSPSDQWPEYVPAYPPAGSSLCGH